jgi:restriction system protein
MIPDYQSVMLPFLKRLADNKEHKFRDLIEELAIDFKIIDEERKELLQSGAQPIFHNRLGWARTYLKKAGLIESPKRAAFKITQRGLDALKEKPEKINVAYLKRFPEFLEFTNLKLLMMKSSILQIDLRSNFRSSISNNKLIYENFNISF